ncbi:MAG: Asp-tRNA(Asn)/Glu-tRNA(Gln) amidotransferase subunit GatB [Candidatus Absconditabacterales bacterium]
MNYILTVGLEIHIKLNTVNKMFCQCKNEQNFETLQANTNICPVCTGQPGTLPTLSQEVLLKSLLLGKALNCKINKISQFDRKSYFYPDLPMGYQITQLYKPTNIEGQVNFFMDNYNKEKIIHIIDAHMECDTGKMIHNGGQALLDFNRSGTPLVEIVTGPDFEKIDEVIEFLKELQRIVRYNGLADADMEKGQMRMDVNVSVRKNEKDKLGTRVEIKNINSFGAIKRAIENEYERQIKIYENGESFQQETRGWDDGKGESYPMRSKEDALDYRYFPEPDLPQLILSEEILKEIEKTDLEIPYKLIKKFKENFGFNKEYINALIGDKEILDYFLDFVNQGFDAKLIVKWIAGPIVAYLKEKIVGINGLKITKNQFSEFLKIAKEGKIMESQLKIVMDEMLSGNKIENIIKEKGFDQKLTNNDEIEKIAKSVLDENAEIVKQYKGGKLTVMGFFVGQVMKKTGGKSNPQIIQEVLKKLLG